MRRPRRGPGRPAPAPAAAPRPPKPAPQAAAGAAADLRRAARLGHRAADVLAGLRGTRAAGPPAVQRKVFLANADQNIYQDTDHDLELSYVNKTGKNRPIFLLYATFQAMQDEVVRAWQDNVVAQGLEKFYQFNAFAQEHIKSNFKEEWGKLFWEDTEGQLRPYPLEGIALLHTLASAAELGPRYWFRGGGSRLPPAKGLLITHGVDLETVLATLGISDKEFKGKYRDVKLVKKDDLIDYLRDWEAFREKGANMIDFDDFFYVSGVEVARSKASRVTAAGAYYADDFTGVDEEKAKVLGGSLASLPAPQVQEWDTVLTPRDRGEGQSKAMGGWNALGAAAFAKRYLALDLPLNQNWEWLHVRGAQIGGETKGGNLVPGLFVTNSAMIPYEAKIAKWSEGKGAKKIAARFGIGSVAHRVFADKIFIQVAAIDHPELGTIPKESPATVEFDPLRGRVVDKMTGRIEQAKLAKQLEKKKELEDIDEDIEIII